MHKQQIPVSQGSTIHLPPTNIISQPLKTPTSNKGNTKKAYPYTKQKVERNFWKVAKRLGQIRNKEKTEWAIGLGRITREKTHRLNQITAPRFLTGGDIRRARPPFEPKKQKRLTMDFESIKINIHDRTRRQEIRQKKRNASIRSRLLRQAMVAEGLFSAGHPTGKSTESGNHFY